MASESLGGRRRSCLQPPWWLGLLIVAIFTLWMGVQSQENEGDYGRSPYDWVGYDKFDEITDRYTAVDKFNCKSKPISELYLPDETVAQKPRFNRLLSMVYYPNRTDMMHIHNMALNRAFFFSYIFQKLNESEDFPYQPGLMYYYFSCAADISANKNNINGSMVMFDSNASYPNWYRNLPFNQTLPLFGPGAFRLDDYNDPTNWLREPTNRTIEIYDYGSGPQSNYTQDSYKTNQWFDMWLPDGWDKAGQDSVRKHSYDVGVKYSNQTGKFVRDEFEALTFFGPPSPGQNEKEHIPVVFTQPYFDCGKSNRWIISAVAPIVDWIPRYLSEWLHIRRFRFVAVSVMSMEFLSVDLNPCPLSIGNEPPNYFAGTARCKPSTMCEPLYGWGFRRGGYKCMCRPGYRQPQWNRGDFLGEDIEIATEEEYKNGFECLPVELRQVIPIIRGNESYGTPQYNEAGRKRRNVKLTKLKEEPVDHYPPEWVRRKHRETKEPAESLEVRMARKAERFRKSLQSTKEITKEEEPNKIHLEAKMKNHKSPVSDAEKRKKREISPKYKRDEKKSRSKRSMAFDDAAYERMQYILEHKEEVTRNNCMNYKREELELPGDVSYGVDKQFTYQARTALRLAHFLSNFLQNIDRYEEYGNLRGDNLLNVELIFGEVLANVMGDLKIKGSGVFYDIDKFEGPDARTRQYFGPYAYRYEDDNPSGPSGDRANTQFRAIDFAGFPTHYLDEPWFKNVKERWQSNTYGLTKFTEKTMVRSDLDGMSLKKFEMYPQYYYAPDETDGWWSPPYFDCDGYVNDWVITYAVPFFGLNTIRSALDFKGVVMVDIKLDELSINQCPQDYYVPNAFKGTARCHYESTYCEFLPSRKFTKGAYKCNCRQGFEYPFNDRAWYFDGQTMEEEYRKLLLGQSSRYHTLHCRIAGASKTASSIVTLAVVAIVSALIS